MTPSEVRAAALRQIKWASMDHCDYVIEEHDDPDGLQRIEDAEATAEHILATVPADDAEPVTVGKLEEWGGVVGDGLNGAMTFARDGQLPIQCVPVDDGWKVVLSFGRYSWADLVLQRNTVGQMRQALEGLGIKLKGGA